MESRTLIMNLAVANDGDWDKIFQQIKSKDFPDINADNQPDYISIVDEIYPERLKRTYKPPFVLFYKGDLSLLSKDNIISVCGAREPTQEGLDQIDKIVKNIDIAIVGGAHGIEGCVIDKAKRPIVVLPHGLDIDPVIVDKVVSKGGLVLTEYTNGIDKSAENCVTIARIIEGLAYKTLVLESKTKSSSLMRVTYSLNLGHDVFVTPHSMNDGYINNQLIKEGAIVCTNAEELYENQ